MIYVTEGHESGIGLEIFLKSFLLLTREEKKLIRLVVKKADLQKNFISLSLNPKLFNDLTIIDNIESTRFSSTNSLLTTLSMIKGDDIMITLPTSKDQLILKNVNQAGYTEFFRTYFKNKNISMTFKALSQNVLLITDHIPLKKVADEITADLIYKKVDLTLTHSKKFFLPFDEVIFSGINPHAGENGILGHEEKEINTAISELQNNHGSIFKGPFSGDILHHHQDNSKNQLFVYMYHDQGLGQFKSRYGLIGLNITFGLPFLRLSVDHGTAFELYGKNKANISGMLYLLKTCFEVINVNQ
ncbi:MAG: 4-hydroxythreonine-4-phosphate dehydrogenase PdxA [Bacteriovorax sp.]|jgi:4-hydroxythreonine-4-phosphate dehydrogenase|nr:4-hydroxythreonine-4-phosphate dehydrogenase PdxA [Bacteriovorax sp.]